MKKIIIPFDGGHFSNGAFSFAKGLQTIRPVLLAGIFLPRIDYARFFFFPTAFSSSAYIPVLEDFSKEDVESNAKQFAQLCKKNFIDYLVYKDLFESPISQLTKETRFADLMIIGGETFYKSAIEYGPHDYLKDALHSTECPVIIVPEEFNFPSHLVLAYDGSASSVFAIKQFAYLFPELCSRTTILVYAGDEQHNIPEEVRIGELAFRHFKDLTINKLTIDHKHDINNWFGRHKNSLVITGSFGRSGLSELFRRSFIMDVIKEHKTPIFIAHQ